MAVYSLSGIVLIFRDSDFLKKEHHFIKTVKANTAAEELVSLLDIRKFKADSKDGAVIYLKEGTYNKETGKADYKIKELPVIIEKMTHLHKAKSADPLFFLNIFFGLSLIFFVISSFWMFMPKTSILKDYTLPQLEFYWP